MKTNESPELQYLTTIKELMRLSDTSVNEIADLIGATRNTVHNYFSGRTAMKVDDLQKVADHFEVTLSTLFTGLNTAINTHNPSEPDLALELAHLREILQEKELRIEEMKMTIESMQEQLGFLKDFYNKFSERG
jgi:transcriptional regulator with XRE-family HTH domain